MTQRPSQATRPTLRSNGRLRRLLSRIRKDQSGVAAVEFALIAPVIVFLYIGLYQISFLIQQDRSVSHATSVMGDLTTRIGFATEDDIADAMQAAVEVLGVTNTTTLSNDIEMDISSYMMDASDNIIRIGFAETSNSTLPPVDTSQFNARMLSQDIGTVVTRVRYQYKMLSNSDNTDDMNSKRYLGDNGITLAEQFVMRPRVSSNIRFGDPDPALPTEEYSCTIDSNRRVSCS